LQQAWLANQLLDRADRLRPIRDPGRRGQFRRALRIAGILSAIKNHRVGNSHFGYSLHGHKGGNVMRNHGPHILAANREQLQQRRQALKAWQQEQQARRPLTPVEERLAQLARQARRPKSWMEW
jgi:hypothetical protein